MAAKLDHSNDVQFAIHSARLAFASGRTRSSDFRRQQIKQILRLIVENESTLVEAVGKDLRRPEFETRLAEAEFVANDARSQLIQLSENMAEKECGRDVPTVLDRAFVHPDPLGVILIIGTWNYPLMVTLSPLIGAIAAGNCAIVKCSELAPQTANLLAQLVPRYLDAECYHVLTGDAQQAQQLLAERFDKIFFTGSQRIGKIVMQKAAQHLTPVVLELGGKSPVYIDSSVQGQALHYAARRILWGKLINSGQTCVAPDYILVHKDAHQALLHEIVNVFANEFFAELRVDSEQLQFDWDKHKKQYEAHPNGHIINRQHFDRLVQLLKSTRGRHVFLWRHSNERDFLQFKINMIAFSAL
jgi:aldehyde dehydrogenase (NAD+)